MAPTKCYYYKCGNNSTIKSLFSFPVNDKSRLQLWIKHSGNEQLRSLMDDELKHRFICEDHFKCSDVRKNFVRSRLAYNAVPLPYEPVTSKCPDLETLQNINVNDCTDPLETTKNCDDNISFGVNCVVNAVVINADNYVKAEFDTEIFDQQQDSPESVINIEDNTRQSKCPIELEKDEIECGPSRPKDYSRRRTKRKNDPSERTINIPKEPEFSIDLPKNPPPSSLLVKLPIEYMENGLEIPYGDFEDSENVVVSKRKRQTAIRHTPKRTYQKTCVPINYDEPTIPIQQINNKEQMVIITNTIVQEKVTPDIEHIQVASPCPMANREPFYPEIDLPTNPPPSELVVELTFNKEEKDKNKTKRNQHQQALCTEIKSLCNCVRVQLERQKYEAIEDLKKQHQTEVKQLKSIIRSRQNTIKKQNGKLKRLRKLLATSSYKRQVMLLKSFKFRTEAARTMALMQIKKRNKLWTESEKGLALSIFAKVRSAAYFNVKKLGIILPANSTVERWIKAKNQPNKTSAVQES